MAVALRVSFPKSGERSSFAAIIQGFASVYKISVGIWSRKRIMPIYAYRCGSCGFGKDVLQKMSDPQLTRCPECGKDTFSKQLTAAGFQLKGSGWYVTDFRGGNAGTSGPATSEAKPEAAAAPAAPAAPAATPAAPAATANTSGSGSA
jgi:putative FmdB family regulatory protein